MASLLFSSPVSQPGNETSSFDGILFIPFILTIIISLANIIIYIYEYAFPAKHNKNIENDRKIATKFIYYELLNTHREEMDSESFDNYFQNPIPVEKCNFLTEEERKIANDFIEHRIYLRKKYYSSGIAKFLKIGWISFCFCIVSLLITIIPQFLIQDKNPIKNTIVNIFAALTIISFVIWLYSRIAKKFFCPICGTKGQKTDSDLESTTTKIERKLLIQETDKASFQGHVVQQIDSDGKRRTYGEQLVTISEYTDYYICPYCNNEWSFKRTEKR